MKETKIKEACASFFLRYSKIMDDRPIIITEPEDALVFYQRMRDIENGILTPQMKKTREILERDKEFYQNLLRKMIPG